MRCYKDWPFATRCALRRALPRRSACPPMHHCKPHCTSLHCRTQPLPTHDPLHSCHYPSRPIMIFLWAFSFCFG